MPDAMTTIPEIDVAALRNVRMNAHVLIDVREPEEYREAHVPGSVLIPLGDLPFRLNDVPCGDALYLICRTGSRSAQAAEFLSKQGLVATNVAGGVVAWIESGEPFAIGDEPG